MNKFKIALLLSYICMASVSAAIITPALPKIEQQFHLGHGALEWVVSIFLVGYVGGQLIYGSLANRFGRLAALRIGLSVNLIGVVLCLIAVALQSYAGLLLGRLVTALGASAGLACTFMLINELLSEHQAKQAVSFAVVSFTLGVGLAVLVGGVVTQYWHWQGCFWILLIQGVVMLLATWLFTETLKQKQSLHIAHLIRGYAQALQSRRLVVFSVIFGFAAVFAYTYAAAAPLVAHHLLHLSAGEYGYWNIVGVAGMLAGGVTTARLIKKLPPMRIIRWVLILMVLCILSLLVLALSGTASSLWFFITAALLYCFTAGLFACGSFYASNAIPDKASASGMMNFISMGSATLSVAVMGYLPFAAIWAFIVIMGAFCLLCLALLPLANRMVAAC